jgi:hypothetical protein
MGRAGCRSGDWTYLPSFSAGKRARGISKRGAGYAVYDPLGQKIGDAEQVFMNRNQEPEYVMVRIGLFRQRSVLIPVQYAEVDDERQILVLK